MPTPELVIFDWDGTLMDSAAHIVDSLQAAARDLMQPVPAAEDCRHIIGLALPIAIRQLFPEADDEVRELLRQRYAWHFVAGSEEKSALFPGALALLEQLLNENRMLAIATGKTRIGLDRVLAQTGLAGYFVITRCADESASKPDPLMLSQILAHTGKRVRDAVMIGDTSYDLAMAKALGMPRIGVSYGAHAVELLLPHEPDVIVDHVSELYRNLV